MNDVETTTALWWVVVFSGIYHGVNPGMGWPLAVSAALMERASSSLYRALGSLALGHLVAVLAILLPFSILFVLVEWHREFQVAAAWLLIAVGIYLLINRRHPRFLARVPPSQLALWSFLVALAHGAGLMLVPVYLGICCMIEADPAHVPVLGLMGGIVAIAVAVALVHTLAMIASGGAIAYGVYRWIGLKFLSKGWFNLDVVWALSLVGVGVISLMTLH